MKIVLIGPAYPLRGGNALFVGHLYEALSAKHTVEVISFSRLYPGFLFPGVRQTDVSSMVLKKHPAQHIIDCINPLSWLKAVRVIAACHPDLIVFTWWNPFFGILVNYIASSLKRKHIAPILIVAENVISHEGRWFDIFLTKIALKTADVFLVLSNVVEQAVKELYPTEKVFKSSLPVYDCYNVREPLTKQQARQRLKISRSRVVLFFGYIRKYKGLMELIEAFSAVKERLVDVHLLIVGEFYDDAKPYYDALDRLNIRGSVTIVPEYVPNESVHIYYSASDLVVLPYREATQSGILSIAYGFSKPVVVTNVGGLAELVDDGSTGYIVPSHDINALSKSIIDYFELNKQAEFERNVARKSEQNSFVRITQLFDDILAYTQSQKKL